MMANTKRLLYVFILAALVLVVTAVMGKRLNSARGVQPATDKPAVRREAKPEATNDEPAKNMKALLFTVRPTGFDPESEEVSAGRLVIVVQNRSGRRDLSFQLLRETGQRLFAVRQERLDWKHQLDLHPGTYFLTEESHPEWRCAIRVTPK